jgi:hypothetical protein
MKKLFAVCVFLTLCFPAFPQGAESGLPDSPAKKRLESALAFGFEYGNFWGQYSDGTQNVETRGNSPAINILTYFFWGEHSVGIFAHGVLLGFPNKGTVNGVQPEYTDYFALQSGLLIGPLFRHKFNNKFTLLYGPGLNVCVTSAEFTEYVPPIGAEATFETITTRIGIGANIMLRYTITHKLLLFAGCVLSYDVFGSVILESPSNPVLNTSGRVQDFSMFGVRPYVSLGFRL